MRVLLLEDNAIDALAVQRELAGRYELLTVGTLAEGIHLLARGAWRPDLVITDLALPDSDGTATVRALQASAGGVPILVSTGVPAGALRHPLDSLLGEDRYPTSCTLRALAMGQSAPLVCPIRHELTGDFDHIAHQVAETAVTRAIDNLVDRLGLADQEGVRMAIRFARGWDAAKARFVSALTTGIASAVLLAIGAGLVAILRQNSPE